MNRIAASNNADRATLFTETASRCGLSKTIIEKDFWVCWTLGNIFRVPEIREQLIFKGGTSLSKVFGVIERFSEDIDLSIRRDVLGFGNDQEPELAPNNTQQKKRLDALRTACRQAVHEHLLPRMRTSFEQVLGKSNTLNPWELSVDPLDSYVLLFTYPSVIEPSEKQETAYIRQVVKLEMGVGSDPYPLGAHTVAKSLYWKRKERFGKKRRCSMRNTIGLQKHRHLLGYHDTFPISPVSRKAQFQSLR